MREFIALYKWYLIVILIPCRLKIDSTYTWSMSIRVQLISTLANIVVQWQNQLYATSHAISLRVYLSYIAKKLCTGNFLVFFKKNLTIVCHWLFLKFLNQTVFFGSLHFFFSFPYTNWQAAVSYSAFMWLLKIVLFFSFYSLSNPFCFLELLV
jgi:hypothetical protein